MEKEVHSDTVSEATQSVVREGLPAVEEAVNTAVGSTTEVVRELPSDTIGAIDQTVGSVKQSLDQHRPRVEQYFETHPWITLGSLLMIWCLRSGNRRIKP